MRAEPRHFPLKHNLNVQRITAVAEHYSPLVDQCAVDVQLKRERIAEARGGSSGRQQCSDLQRCEAVR
jgi:hypothetical protein